MPWETPTLEELRSLNRDNVQSQLRSGPLIPNSGLRVLADANAGLAYLTLLYLNWLALQLMPDTAETKWLDRFGDIWVGGRKAATFATGSINLTGLASVVVPAGSQLTAQVAADGTTAILQTIAPVTLIGSSPTPATFVALTAGITGLAIGSTVSLSVGIAGVNGAATVTAISDGVDAETDDELRARVLMRIRQPPMGGDAEDYVAWALEVPGVTRAWCAPNEMGVGTVTVRFMMDDLRATTNPSTNGFPLTGDVTTVAAHLNSKRPVAIKDFFVEAPLPEPVNFTVSGLYAGATDPVSLEGAVTTAVTEMLFERAAPSSSVGGVLIPATTIFAAWVSGAILGVTDVESFDLVMSDLIMPGNGYLAVMGTITYTG